MFDHEPCHELVKRTGVPDAACLESAAVHVAHDLYLLRHAWVDQELRIGWTLWFITARALMDFFFVYERTRNKQGQYSDDILAADFLPAGAWKARALQLAAEQPAAEAFRCSTTMNSTIGGKGIKRARSLRVSGFCLERTELRSLSSQRVRPSRPTSRALTS